MKKKQKYILSRLSRVFFMIVGSILAAIGLEMFLIPNNIIDGGITGISIMVSHFTKISLGVLIFVLNLPFLYVGYKKIGKTFAISTLFSVICFSIGVSIFRPLLGVTHDTLLATIFGGIILGAGIGIIMRSGGSLDGTEIVAIILDNKSSFSVGEIVMFFNLFILGGSGLVFGWDRAMYSLIAYFVASKTIDITVEGVNESKAVTIISDRHEEISKSLTHKLGRGVTLLYGQGSYKENPTNVIYIVVSRLEISKLRDIVHAYDKNALISIGSVEVTGKVQHKKTYK